MQHYRIDAATDAKAAQWEVGYPLKWVAMRPDGAEVWCTPLNWDTHTGVLENPIAVVDPKTGTFTYSCEAGQLDPTEVRFVVSDGETRSPPGVLRIVIRSQ